MGTEGTENHFCNRGNASECVSGRCTELARLAGCNPQGLGQRTRNGCQVRAGIHNESDRLAVDTARRLIVPPLIFQHSHGGHARLLACSRRSRGDTLVAEVVKGNKAQEPDPEPGINHAGQARLCHVEGRTGHHQETQGRMAQHETLEPLGGHQEGVVWSCPVCNLPDRSRDNQKGVGQRIGDDELQKGDTGLF